MGLDADDELPIDAGSSGGAPEQNEQMVFTRRESGSGHAQKTAATRGGMARAELENELALGGELLVTGPFEGGTKGAVRHVGVDDGGGIAG